MKKIVNETERGFLYENGKFIRMAAPGKVSLRRGAELKTLPLSEPPCRLADEATLRAYVTDEKFREQTVSVTVADGQRALRFCDGCFVEGLTPGRYLFWNVGQQNDFEMYDIKDARIEGISRDICGKLLTQGLVRSVTVAPDERGACWTDGVFQELLEPGTYYFWEGTDLVCERVRVDLRELDLVGQEILTKDRVGIRLNFVCSYRVTDPLKAVTRARDFEALFRTAAALSVRDCVAGLTLDELLGRREQIGEEIAKPLRTRAAELFIEVPSAGIRDIVLPGDVREILNTVLLAEKQAQANVITRREEVASTRSLLNTARLMDENKTLYKLKELEYLQKICEKIGSLNVNGGDLPGQLRAVLGLDESGEK